MIKLKINRWDLQRLAKDKHDIYVKLHEAIPALPSPNNVDKGYEDFEAYIQDVSALPQEILDIAKWEAIQPMKVLFEDKSKGKGIKEALAAYQVHLPGNELLAIQSVDVIEDACTDDLQRKLDHGWRIVSVCVRSGQRRPDYVLGRFTRL